ncbi:MAG: hypothetical protein HY094_09390 [Candidatus Melainabacteria bacterium]|nr:hypothetical protein [Candidatus Melainabacteria bacterium]
MPAYLIPISGTSKPVTLQWNAHICGRKKAFPHELVIKEFERSIRDNSDYPLGSLTLMNKADFAEFELHLPYRHKTKLATDLAHSSAGFYIFQYVGGFKTFVEKHGDIDILVNKHSLKTLTNEIYDGLILTNGDEITFTEGGKGNLKFYAESFRFSLKLGE